MTDTHPELRAEQARVDAAYGRLAEMRRSAARVVEGFADVGAGGTHQARLERDAAAAVTRRRLAALDMGDSPLVFGRLDLGPAAAGGDDAPDRYYVGRVAVDGDDQLPFVVDWRAPVAEPFYRATAVAPMGVVRRRHFLTKPGEGRVLLGIDDEVFDPDAADAAGLAVVGEGALLAALERARTGRMGDIVATIQAEQDEAIRADLPGALVVTGGAGTGKTAVALHRAAYLLYTHRRRLGAQGVLLVGPSPLFLRYIDEVLPSLGEDEVVLATPSGLKPQLRVRGTDTSNVARTKGDARMARVIARAVRDREHPLARDLVVALDGQALRLARGRSAGIVERARGRRGTHNERRPQVIRQAVEHLRAQYRAGLGASAPDDPEWELELDGRIRRMPEVRAALHRMWPVLTGPELVHDLLSFAALVRSASDGILGAEEQAGLVRPRSPSVHDVAWTESDLALIDEADALLGPPESARPRHRRARRRIDDGTAARVVAELGVGAFVRPEELAQRYAGSAASTPVEPEEPRTFGHVLVDEAQDLSAMQWRMLARRCPSGSMTLVGDFGQASRPGALSSWDEVRRHLPDRARPRVVTLSVNYRTPAEIMEVAHRVLAAGAPGVEATRAVRHTGIVPHFVAASPGSLVDAVAQATRAARRGPGTVAVVAPQARHAAIVAALGDVGALAGTVEALDAPVAVLTPLEVKGLEFDDVVVVEPAELVNPDSAGLRLLYVTLTRATRELWVIHARPLPEALEPRSTEPGPTDRGSPVPGGSLP